MDPLVSGLRAMSHTIVSVDASRAGSVPCSGYSNGVNVLQGGADPRREGLMLGDTFKWSRAFARVDIKPRLWHSQGASPVRHCVHLVSNFRKPSIFPNTQRCSSLYLVSRWFRPRVSTVPDWPIPSRHLPLLKRC